MTPELKLTFGDPESQKRAKTRLRAIKEIRPTEDDPLRVLPLIEQLVVRERERREVLEGEGLDAKSLAQEIFGPEGNKGISPSLVSKCLRWWGYEELGYKPLSRSFNSILRLESGKALHYALGRLLWPMGPREYRLIHSWGENMEMRGKVDILFRNPRLDSEIGNYQVVEIKTVSTEAFRRQLNRKNLRPDLVPTKGIVAPRESDKKQIGLYLRLLESQGTKAACANIIYIDRNNLDVKEALIPWDAITQSEVDEFVERIKEAKRLIDQGELPQPTVDSIIPCGYYCDFRLVCDARPTRIVKTKKPVKAWVRKKAKEERERREEIMEELGLVQPTLGGDFKTLIHQ